MGKHRRPARIATLAATGTGTALAGMGAAVLIAGAAPAGAAQPSDCAPLAHAVVHAAGAHDYPLAYQHGVRPFTPQHGLTPVHPHKRAAHKRPRVLHVRDYSQLPVTLGPAGGEVDVDGGAHPGRYFYGPGEGL